MPPHPRSLSVMISILCCSLGFAADQPALEQRVDAYLQPYLEIDHLSGVILIAHDGEVKYEKAFGFASYEHRVANTPSTRFCAGSIKKPMTIVVLARLLDADKLALDDTLETYLPGFPQGDTITVEMLLRHSAGIPHRVTEAIDEIRPQPPRVSRVFQSTRGIRINNSK